MIHGTGEGCAAEKSGAYKKLFLLHEDSSFLLLEKCARHIHATQPL
jgi:hypothetical protein